MCETRPCWPTPDEAKAIIEAGLGDRLMLDYWESDDGPINIVSPAIQGRESDHAPFFPHGQCTFLKGGRCELHDLGLKPVEGRLAHHDGRGGEALHEAVAESWRNEQSQAFADTWAEQHIYGE